jgi:hypothetical protein
LAKDGLTWSRSRTARPPWRDRVRAHAAPLRTGGVRRGNSPPSRSVSSTTLHGAAPDRHRGASRRGQAVRRPAPARHRDLSTALCSYGWAQAPDDTDVADHLDAVLNRCSVHTITGRR